MNLAKTNSAPQEIKARFLFHLIFWMGIYGTVVLAWGARNAWPAVLWGAIFFFIISLLFSCKLYRENAFGLETVAHPSEWELFITYLVLAIGVASGLLLLVAVGWVCVGLAWLRPARRHIALGEWLKLPLLFLLSFPVLLDLAGSRHDWFQYFGGSGANAFGELPYDLVLLRLHMLGGVGILVLAFALKGPWFWFSIPLVPLLIFIGTQLNQHWQVSFKPGLVVTESFGWLFVPVMLIVYVSIVKILAPSSSRAPRLQAGLTQWLEGQSYLPWLISLVILLQQSSLAERWLAGTVPRFNLTGAIVLCGVLFWLRWRGAPEPVHTRSRMLLAAALFVLLAAEWTDLNSARHLAFGLLLIGLLGWRRTWPWHVLLAAAFTWVTTLPLLVTMLQHVTFESSMALSIRLACFLAGIVYLAVATLRFKPVPYFGSYDDYGWQPIKRFGFTLLCLLLVFQTASAFWREPQPESPARINDEALTPLPIPPTLTGMANFQHWRGVRPNDEFELVVGQPTSIPFQLDAPELLLKSWGWQVQERRLIPHPSGQAVQLQMGRHERLGSAIYWFEHDEHAFANYLRGRRILWSGWNLARRDLRLVLVFSNTQPEADKLLQFAESKNWFRPVAMAPGK